MLQTPPTRFHSDCLPPSVTKNVFTVYLGNWIYLSLLIQQNNPPFETVRAVLVMLSLPNYNEIISLKTNFSPDLLCLGDLELQYMD